MLCNLSFLQFCWVGQGLQWLAVRVTPLANKPNKNGLTCSRCCAWNHVISCCL
jgi:hypothetical protein